MVDSESSTCCKGYILTADNNFYRKQEAGRTVSCVLN